MAIFNFLLTISTFVIIAFVFFLPLHFYRSFYLKDISCVELRRGGSPLICPVKPDKKFFRNISHGNSCCFVNCGNGYLCYIVSSDSSDRIDINSLDLSDRVYILRRNRFGRYLSLDVSDRVLIDLIQKFNLRGV